RLSTPFKNIFETDLSSTNDVETIFSGNTIQKYCPLCEKILPKDLKKSIPLNLIKQKLIKEILKYKQIKNLSARVCMQDLNVFLQNRIEILLEEDKNSFSELQEESLHFLDRHEAEEEGWQDQFETKRNFSEKSADNVAKFGGSWRFVLVTISLIFGWAFANLALEDSNYAWDPYPFILLNLFLSVIAALQGPVIMMSQNRQQEIDRIQNNFISKMILRGEHQTRQVNAKMDYMMTNQWRRNLEIQEIQVDLLNLIYFQQQQTNMPFKFNNNNMSSTNSNSNSNDNIHFQGDEDEFDSSKVGSDNEENKLNLEKAKEISLLDEDSNSVMNLDISNAKFKKFEIQVDYHSNFLLRSHLKKPSLTDKLIFSHWTNNEEEGKKLMEKFEGTLEKVELEFTDLEKDFEKSLNLISYDISFENVKGNVYLGYFFFIFYLFFV
ncbi:hypothetical protein HK099_002404, partial [Clydaea vesicula]